jgi:SAM-dependent methyltransferase
MASDDWRRWLDAETVPWLDRLGDLGDDVLELGAGPGLTTDLLRRRAARVTAVELDHELASALAARLGGTNVEVIEADAGDTGRAGESYSAVACFSMLHHVPSSHIQDRVFSEVRRLLRPGGVFLAVDSLDNAAIRQFHEDDVFVPLGAETLERRLAEAGFGEVSLETTDFELRFHATKPG